MKKSDVLTPERQETITVKTRRDRLNYMSDMLSELQAMAAKEGCITLSGLLDLAKSEAALQARGAGRT